MRYYLRGLGSRLNPSLPENAQYEQTINDEVHVPGPVALLPDDVETSLRIGRLQPMHSSNMVPIGELPSDSLAWKYKFGHHSDAHFSAASTMDGVECCYHPYVSFRPLSGRRPNVDVFPPSSDTHPSSDFPRSFVDHFAPAKDRNTEYYSSSNNSGADGGCPSGACERNDGDSAYYEDGLTATDRKDVPATDMSHFWAFG